MTATKTAAKTTKPACKVTGNGKLVEHAVRLKVGARSVSSA